MTNELKPIRCGCGGEARTELSGEPFAPWIVKCPICGIRTELQDTEAEAITAWNRAMGSTEKYSTVERTAKVIEHDASITDDRGYKYLRSEYLCENCMKKVIGGDEYCSHCGARLEWK